MKKINIRFCFCILVLCVLTWTILLFALTQRTNALINASVENELLLPLTARRHSIRATAALGRADYKSAIEDFDTAIAIYFRLAEREGSIDYVLGIADCLVGRGRAHHGLGKFTEALEDYALLEMYCNIFASFGEPDLASTRRADYLVSRAGTLVALGKYDAAVIDFDRAFGIYLQLQQEQDDQVRFRLMLVDCMIRCGNVFRGLRMLTDSYWDYDNAIDLCGQISQIDLEATIILLLARAYFNRSIAHAMQGEFAFAFLDLESTRTCAIRYTRIVMDRLSGPLPKLLSPTGSQVHDRCPETEALSAPGCSGL